MRMDEMECICGEVLRAEQSDEGEKELGNLAKLYAEHMSRPDHKANPAQWLEAYKKIEGWKEKAKRASTTESR